MDSKKVSFIGKLGADIIIYVSQILYQQGKHVLVIDHSENEELMEIVGEENLPDIVCYQGVDFTNKEINKLKAQYDTIISYQSAWIKKEADIIYLISSCNRKELEQLLIWKNEINHEGTIIVRDLCTGKINEKFLTTTYLKKNQGNWNIIMLPFDCVDYEYRIRMTYEPIQGFPHLSFELMDLLYLISYELTGIDGKHQKRAYQRASKGYRKRKEKHYADCILE